VWRGKQARAGCRLCRRALLLLPLWGREGGREVGREGQKETRRERRRGVGEGGRRGREEEEGGM